MTASESTKQWSTHYRNKSENSYLPCKRLSWHCWHLSWYCRHPEEFSRSSLHSGLRRPDTIFENMPLLSGSTMKSQYF